MLKLLGKLLGGNKSEKDVNKIRPVIAQINAFFQEYQSLSNDALRNKTQEFKQEIHGSPYKIRLYGRIR